MLVHLFSVEVGDQKTNVIAIDGLPPQYNKVLRPHHHEPHELLAQYLLNFVGLFDGDADPDGVDGRLDVHFFLVVT